MIRGRFCYLLLLAAGSYFIMLYNFQGLRFLFGCILCIPAVSFLFLIPVKLFCRIRLEGEQEFVERGELPEIQITVENRGFFPVSRILLEMRWKEPGTKERRIRKWVQGMGGHTQEYFIPEMTAMHCGLATLTLVKARVYDYLGIFALPVRLTEGRKRIAEVCVVPVIAPVPHALEETFAQVWQETGEEKEGDLLLRDCQPGDSLHRIYWKIMAKAGDLQVRDFESSGYVSLYLHFSDSFRTQTEAWDRYLDRAASLLYFFAEECRVGMQMPTEVVWQQGQEFFRCMIPDGAAVYIWLCVFLREGTAEGSVSAEEVPFPERGWHLEEDCRLYYGEQCVYEE